MANGNSLKSQRAERSPVCDSDHCDVCDGLGFRVPASPSCRLPAIDDEWEIIERCDTCEVYVSDLEAGLAVMCDVVVIICDSGGTHVAGRR